MTAKPRSLQRRIAAGLLGGAAIIWVAAFLIGGYVVREEIDEVFDSAMSETAIQMLSLAARGDIYTPAPKVSSDRPAKSGENDDVDDVDDEKDEHKNKGDDDDESYLRILLKSPAGDIVVRSREMPDVMPAPGFSEQERYRFYRATSSVTGYTVVIAERLGHRTEAAREAAMALALPMLALLPFAVAAGFLLLRSGFLPVRNLGRQIERRGAGDLSPLDRTGLPAELQPVAQSVDSLMERIRRALEAERSFTANSAHEIRTPIAAALAQTQLLASEALPPGTRQKVGEIEEGLRRLAALAEKLMQLARADGAGLLSDEPGDLAPALDVLVEEMGRRQDAAGRIVLDRVADEPLLSRMDVDAFAVLVRNLVENALVHGEAGGPVRIRVRNGEVSVMNRGRVVPPGDLDGLRDRFRRGRTDADGSGLGLAIADAIVRGCGASLDLRSPARNRQDGFEAIVRLT